MLSTQLAQGLEDPSIARQLLQRKKKAEERFTAKEGECIEPDGILEAPESIDISTTICKELTSLLEVK